MRETPTKLAVNWCRLELIVSNKTQKLKLVHERFVIRQYSPTYMREAGSNVIYPQDRALMRQYYRRQSISELTVIRQLTATMVVRRPVLSINTMSRSMIVSVSSIPVRQRLSRKMRHPVNAEDVTALNAFIVRVKLYIRSRSGKALIETLFEDCKLNRHQCSKISGAMHGPFPVEYYLR